MESVNPVPDGVPATTTPPPVASLATEGEGRGAGAEDPSSGGKKGNQGGRRMIITRARSRRSQEEVTVGSPVTSDLSDSNLDPNDSECTLSNTETPPHPISTSRVAKERGGTDLQESKRLTRGGVRRLLGKGGRMREGEGGRAAEEDEVEAEREKQARARKIVVKTKAEQILRRTKAAVSRRSRRVQRRRETLESIQSSGSSDSSDSETSLRREVGRRRVTRRGSRKRHPQSQQDSEYSPSGAKKKCHNDTIPPIGNILANILNDIPEIDTRPVELSAANIALLKSQGFEMTRSSHFTTSSLPQDEHKMGSCTIPPGNLPLCQTTDRKAPSHSTTGNKEPAKLGPSCSKRPVLTSSRPIHLLESANFSTVSNLKSGPNSSKLNSKRTGTKPNQASRASVSRSRSSSEARSGRSSTSNADSATNPDPKCRWHAADSATKKPNKGGAEESSPCSAESATKKLGRRVERESNHYKSLRSWEGDLALGDMARHGPVLYALDKLQDKLESDLPWLAKARIIWTHWRHRVPEEERRVYTEKAKLNRQNIRSLQPSVCRRRVASLGLGGIRTQQPAEAQETREQLVAETQETVPQEPLVTVIAEGRAAVVEPSSSATSTPSPVCQQTTPEEHVYSGSEVKEHPEVNDRSLKSQSLPPFLTHLTRTRYNKFSVASALADVDPSILSSQRPVTKPSRSRSLSPSFLPPRFGTRAGAEDPEGGGVNKKKEALANSSWYIAPSSQIGSFCSSSDVLPPLRSLSPEKVDGSGSKTEGSKVDGSHTTATPNPKTPPRPAVLQTASPAKRMPIEDKVSTVHARKTTPRKAVSRKLPTKKAPTQKASTGKHMPHGHPGEGTIQRRVSAEKGKDIPKSSVVSMASEAALPPDAKRLPTKASIYRAAGVTTEGQEDYVFPSAISSLAVRGPFIVEAKSTLKGEPVEQIQAPDMKTGQSHSAQSERDARNFEPMHSDLAQQSRKPNYQLSGMGSLQPGDPKNFDPMHSDLLQSSKQGNQSSGMEPLQPSQSCSTQSEHDPRNCDPMHSDLTQPRNAAKHSNQKGLLTPGETQSGHDPMHSDPMQPGSATKYDNPSAGTQVLSRHDAPVKTAARVRSNRKPSQGLSPLLSSRVPHGLQSFVIPQMPAFPTPGVEDYLASTLTFAGGSAGVSRNSPTELHSTAAASTLHSPRSTAPKPAPSSSSRSPAKRNSTATSAFKPPSSACHGNTTEQHSATTLFLKPLSAPARSMNIGVTVRTSSSSSSRPISPSYGRASEASTEYNMAAAMEAGQGRGWSTAMSTPHSQAPASAFTREASNSPAVATDRPQRKSPVSVTRKSPARQPWTVARMTSPLMGGTSVTGAPGVPSVSTSTPPAMAAALTRVEAPTGSNTLLTGHASTPIASTNLPPIGGLMAGHEDTNLISSASVSLSLGSSNAPLVGGDLPAAAARHQVKPPISGNPSRPIIRAPRRDSSHSTSPTLSPVGSHSRVSNNSRSRSTSSSAMSSPSPNYPEVAPNSEQRRLRSLSTHSNQRKNTVHHVGSLTKPKQEPAAKKLVDRPNIPLFQPQTWSSQPGDPTRTKTWTSAAASGTSATSSPSIVTVISSAASSREQSVPLPPGAAPAAATSPATTTAATSKDGSTIKRILSLYNNNSCFPASKPSVISGKGETPVSSSPSKPMGQSTRGSSSSNSSQGVSAAPVSSSKRKTRSGPVSKFRIDVGTGSGSTLRSNTGTRPGNRSKSKSDVGTCLARSDTGMGLFSSFRTDGSVGASRSDAGMGLFSSFGTDGSVGASRSDAGMGLFSSFRTDAETSTVGSSRGDMGMGLDSTYGSTIGMGPVGSFRGNMGMGLVTSHGSDMGMSPPGGSFRRDREATGSFSSTMSGNSIENSRKASIASLKSEMGSPLLPVASFHNLGGTPTPLIVAPPTPYLSEVTEILLPKPHKLDSSHVDANGGHFHSTGHGAPSFGSPHQSGETSATPTTISPQPNPAVMPAAAAVDLSKMSRWEIEQLYYYNAAILEEQKKLMRVIEEHLAKSEQGTNAHKPTSFEVYQKFLDFLTEPETVASADLPFGSYGYEEPESTLHHPFSDDMYQHLMNK